MRIALVHDFLTQFGGAERVLLAIHEVWPEAPVYTSVVAQEIFLKLGEFTSVKWEVRPSFLQTFPPARWFTKYFTFLVPQAFEQFDLAEFDVVISSSANFAKGIITRPDQLHICYCHTPTRFLYHYPTETNKRRHSFWGPVLRPLDHYLRIWDFAVAQRVDYFVANSYEVARRIQKFYRRKATVIYPPVKIRMNPNENIPSKSEHIIRKHSEHSDQGTSEHYLLVSRLSAYKNVDLAIKACNQLKLPLKIIGTGVEEGRLKELAGSTVEFLGFVNEQTLANCYTNCHALIFPASDEDFGIVPVEAVSFGKPVIALRSGGVVESVLEGQTGVFFDEPTVESLVEVLGGFDATKFDSQKCLDQAAKFNKEQFQEDFQRFVESKWLECRRKIQV